MVPFLISKLHSGERVSEGDPCHSWWEQPFYKKINSVV